MQLASVIGTATSTIKHASMEGWKLLLVQPRMVDGTSPDGEPVLAVDGIGAGKGETVMITSDGRFTRDLLNAKATPVRWSVVGIAD
jgi:microcompartment protein CcmK/EutM